MTTFYAVAKGKKPGIYRTWEQCQQQINGFKDARFKKFATLAEAKQFAFGDSSGSSADSSTGSPAGCAGGSSAGTSAGSLQTGGNDAKKRKRTREWSSGEEVDCDPTGPASTWREELQQLRQEVEDISSTLKAFVEEKTSALDQVKATLDRIIGGGGSVKKAKQEQDLHKNKDNFIISDDHFVQVFTDGSCENNGRHGAIAGIGVWFNHGHRLNTSLAVPAGKRQTNNVAEIMAATAAVRTAKTAGVQKLCINTDSKFVINCVELWMNGWKKKGWVTANNSPVVNKEELLELDGVIREDPQFKLRWNHVRGHQGIEGNELADELAKMGARKKLSETQ